MNHPNDVADALFMNWQSRTNADRAKYVHHLLFEVPIDRFAADQLLRLISQYRTTEMVEAYLQRL